MRTIATANCGEFVTAAKGTPTIRSARSKMPRPGNEGSEGFFAMINASTALPDTPSMTWECDAADLRAYKRVRLHTPGPAQVSVATWRRSIAALDKWAAWALYEGLIGRLPFRYVDRKVFTPQGMRQVRINAESEPDPGPVPVKFVSFEDYLLWRDVGLRGRFPDGGRIRRGGDGMTSATRCWRTCSIYTGMRLCEASCLLVPELPGQRGAASGLGAIHLGAAVTKGSRAWTVFAPARLVRGTGPVHTDRAWRADGADQRRRIRAR